MSLPAKEIHLEAYPAGTLCLSLGHMTLSYALGILIFNQIHALLGAAYLMLCIACLFAGLKYRCRFCWYFGKTCYAGLGKVAKLIFKPGEPQEFAKPSNVIPVAVISFTVLLLPLTAILIMSIAAFSWRNLALLGTYLVLVVVAGFTMRKSFFCDHCKQAELGCPAFEGMQGKYGTKA